jgi:hypothetical protein
VKGKGICKQDNASSKQRSNIEQQSTRDDRFPARRDVTAQIKDQRKI